MSPLKQLYTDPYAVCAYVRRYQAKNGYAPTVEHLPCDGPFVQKLIANGVIEVLPLYDGGPPVAVVLTDKGRRMAARR